LARRILFPRGAPEGIVAPGGEVDGALPQAHGVLDRDDLELRDGGEAGFLVQARRGGFGDHGVRRFGQGQEHPHPGAFAPINACAKPDVYLCFPTDPELQDVEFATASVHSGQLRMS